MTLRRGLLFGVTAATLFGQEFPHIDGAKIERAMENMKLARQEMLAHSDLFEHASAGIALAREAMAMDRIQIAMHRPFFPGPKDGGGALTEDEQLKIMAIDNLMQSDSERAIPLLDKLLRNQQASMRVRTRALQALGNSNSPKAREIIIRVAKDGSSEELQLRAVQLLGSREGSQNRQALSEVYSSSGSADVKRHVLRSWGSMGAKEQLVSAAKSEQNPELRAAAIKHLGGMRAAPELVALYSGESSTEVRERLLRALSGTGEWQRLLEIARTEKNEELRNRAIQQVGGMRSAGSSAALAEMYTSGTDASTRKAILKALSSQGDAKQMIALARKETDPELKRAALQHLSGMKGDEVTTYLVELLDK